MARTIFGLFNKIVLEKAQNKTEATIEHIDMRMIAAAYKISMPCVLLAYKLWKFKKLSEHELNSIAAHATKLTPKDKVFLYNSLVPVADMAFENTPHNWGICFGNKAMQVMVESSELGVFDVSDKYFFADKDFGLLSFNELRNVELAGAIATWYEESGAK